MKNENAEHSTGYREARLGLIGKWQFHNPETGLFDWKPDAPESAKSALRELCADVEREFIRK